jgi:hypothetical protein
VGSAGAFVTFNGALGTPSSGVATNLTGTATALNIGGNAATATLAATASAVAVGGITGLGTGVATALAVNVGSAGAPVLFNGAGGTPSSITLTNASGTAASLTSGTVTTNANLTGPITSTGNATAVASQTGTGSTFVMDTSPTIATPTITGAAWTAPTLAGTWVNFNSGYSPAGYYKDPMGFVHLRGLVVSGTANTTIFTLPVGSRPPYINNLIASVNGAATNLIIGSDGTIASSGGATGGVYLDGIIIPTF